jgi:hypothetical protein
MITVLVRLEFRKTWTEIELMHRGAKLSISNISINGKSSAKGRHVTLAASCKGGTRGARLRCSRIPMYSTFKVNVSPTFSLRGSVLCNMLRGDRKWVTGEPNSLPKTEPVEQLVPP